MGAYPPFTKKHVLSETGRTRPNLQVAGGRRYLKSPKQRLDPWASLGSAGCLLVKGQMWRKGGKKRKKP